MNKAMPKRPLYKESDIASLPEKGNAGLWYDKFCNCWKGLNLADRQNGKVEIKKHSKNGDGWIDTVTKRSCGNSEELERQTDRQWNMVEVLNGQNLCLKTNSPFVTGLGREHPVENGFLWHHTLGVPYLPGSSVKGIVRAWIGQWVSESNPDEINRIFGTKPSQQSQVGEVIFLDSIPLGPVKLKADVMTPHYTNYYQNQKNELAPGDWISPVPIPFLVVKEGATFHFAILPQQQSAEAKEHCKTVCNWLKGALKWIGAGAKTAVGYGRMSFDEKKQQRCEEKYSERREHEKRERINQKAKQGLPEDAKWVIDQRKQWTGSDPNKNKTNFLTDTEKFLTDKERLSSEACECLCKKMSEFWPGIIENPDAAKGKKKKPKYKERLRELAKKLNALCLREK